MSRYLPYKRFSNLRIGGVWFFDIVGKMVLGAATPCPPPKVVTHLCVAKLDQLGDLLIATATLAALRRHFAGAKLNLLTGSWNRPIASLLVQTGAVDTCIYYDAIGCNKRDGFARRVWCGMRSAIQALRLLRKDRPDIWIDLRQRSPNSLLLARLVGAKWRMGYGVRGLAFTLHAEIPYIDQEALGDSFLRSLPILGGPYVEYSGPVLPVMARTEAVDKILNGVRDFAILHPFSRDVERAMPAKDANLVIELFRQKRQLVLVGSASELEGAGNIAEQCRRAGVINLAGKTRMSELLELVERAKCVVCVDSMVAHLAVAYAKPAIVLMRSGASVRESYPRIIRTMRFVSLESEMDVRTEVEEMIKQW